MRTFMVCLLVGLVMIATVATSSAMRITRGIHTTVTSDDPAYRLARPAAPTTMVIAAMPRPVASKQKPGSTKTAKTSAAKPAQTAHR